MAQTHSPRSTVCERCGSSQFHVRYEAPLYAVVEDGAVRRVVVDDEAIAATPSSQCADCGEGGTAACAAATRVAETASWPGWDTGW
jgi:hypothetical protein